MMKKYTHVECLEDVIEEDVVLFKKGKIYPIVGFDYLSLLYYVEPEYDEEGLLPAEFAIYPLNSSFKFL